MRNLFWALVFANVAYFAWSHWVDVPRPPPVNEAIARLPRLKLASEPPPPSPRGSGAGPERTVFSATPCLSVGPFGDADGSARAAALLQAKGFESRQRTETTEPSIEYGVYVGGLKSDAEASRVLRGLQKGGFKDAAIATDSRGGERRVSLGVFRDRGRADVRSAAARSRGFRAEVSERKSSGILYWLDLTPPPGTTTVPIQDLFAEGLGSRIAVQSCPAAAAPAAPVTAQAAPPAAPAPATASISKVP